MRRVAYPAVLSLLLLVALAPHVRAQGSVDQSVTTYPEGAVAVSNSQPAAWGQTFTAGKSGQLDSVSLDLFAPTTPTTATVSVYAMTAGVPFGAALASGEATITESATPPASFTLVTLSPAVTVAVGTQYALVLGPATTTGGEADWASPASDEYSGGNAFSLIGGSVADYAPALFDLNFQTFVTPASGPVAAVLPVSGARTVTPLGVTISGCGSVSPSTLTTASSFQALPVTAIPCTGSVFSGWVGGPCDGTRINPCDIAPSGLTGVTAVFTP